MRERLIILFQQSVSWFTLWYLLYGKANNITGVCLFTGEVIIPGVFLYLLIAGVKLSKAEKFALTGTYCVIGIFDLYMILCLFSIPTWVSNHNFKMGIFIVVNTLFNLYSTYRLRSEIR